MKKRNTIVLTILSLVVFSSGLYLFFPEDARKDIFLFYEYVNTNTGVKGRLVVNIVNELSQRFTTFTLLLLWYFTVSFKTLKNVILPFLIISFLDIIDYIGWFQQHSIYKLPILVVLIVVYNFKYKKNE